MLINSHFVFFLQEKHQFIQIMTLCKPSQMLKELTDKIESQNVLAVSSIEMIRVKVLECIATLCKQQTHYYFRGALLTTKPLTAKIIKYVLQAFKLNNETIVDSYLQFYFAVTLGHQHRGITIKSKKQIYIPGETQEHRRLKRRTIQVGTLLIADMIIEKFPHFKDRFEIFFAHFEDEDYLYNFMVLY